MLRILPALAMFALVTGHAAAQSKAEPALDAMLVLDASGSMWGQVGGRPKIEAARGAVGAILGRWRAGDRLGLVVYGHRSKSDCKDIETVVPLGSLDAGQMNAAVGRIVPQGRTPIAESLKAAAGALKGSAKASVILVSDGIETCAADPCAVAAELKKAAVTLTAHVVGFDVADPVAKAQLQCIARATGGVYLDARDAGGLQQALGRAVDASRGAKVASEAPKAAPKDPLAGRNLRAVARLAAGLDPITDSGLAWTLHQPDIAPGEPGEALSTDYGSRLAITAKPGRYVLRVQWHTVQRDIPLEVTAGRILEQDVVLDAGFVTSAGSIEGSGARADGVTWEVFSGDEVIATSYDDVPKFVLPAGNLRLRLTKGSATAEKDFALAAGDVLNLPLGLDAGKLLASAIYAPGGPKVTVGQAFEIRRPPAQEGEEGEVVAGSYDPEASFDLPSGSYDVIVSVGRAVAKRRVEVRSGQPLRVQLELGAGVVGIKAAKAEAIEIRAAEPDINGEHAFVDGDYAETREATLPAGDYLAVATRGDNKVEKRFTVTAGKRTEVVLAP